jgi:hypothetical protein
MDTCIYNQEITVANNDVTTQIKNELSDVLIKNNCDCGKFYQGRCGRCNLELHWWFHTITMKHDTKEDLRVCNVCFFGNENSFKTKGYDVPDIDHDALGGEADDECSARCDGCSMLLVRGLCITIFTRNNDDDDDDDYNDRNVEIVICENCYDCSDSFRAHGYRCDDEYCVCNAAEDDDAEDDAKLSAEKEGEDATETTRNEPEEDGK